MRPEFIEILQKILLELDSHQSRVLIIEQISINGENFDRHFTSTSQFNLSLVSATIRTSGGIMMLEGADSCYELNVGLMYKFHREGDEIEFFERLADKVVRKTKIVLRGNLIEP